MRRIRIKTVVLIVVAAVSIALMGVLLSSMQTMLTLDSYTKEMQHEADALPALLEEASGGVADDTANYDEFFQSKVESIAFMANHDTGFEATDAKMAEYRDLLGVDNVIVASKDGGVLASANPVRADFSYARFNQLRTVFENSLPSEAVEISLPEDEWVSRYYAARIDDSTVAVISQSPAELDELVQATGSTESVLKNISIGQHGFMFAVSALDYSIVYHPDSNLVGADAIVEGIDASQLEDGAFGTAQLRGEDLYCGVTQIDDMYYIAAVPESDMAATRAITVGVILFIFFAVLTVVILYGVFVMRDDERNGFDSRNYREMGPFRYNKKVGRKVAVFSFVGFLAILGVSFYMQTLFALSSESMTNNEQVAEVVETMEATAERSKALSDQYGERCLSKCEVAGYILDQNPGLADKDDLYELSKVLQVQSISVFDGNGVMTATNLPFTDYALSENPDDQSYEFRRLLQGVSSVVQDPQDDELTGELRQYIGVQLHDARGNSRGLVQIGIRPDSLENLLQSLKIGNVLDGVKSGSEGFAFAVNKSDNTFAYYPDERLEGKSAIEAGMAEGQLKNGFCDYITIDGKTYYASSAETDNYYLYVAGPEGELMAERVPLTLAAGGVALVCLIVLFLLLTLESRRGFAPVRDGDKDPESRMFDVTMPSGRTAKTESAASRWLARSFAWGEKTPEQKTATVVRWLVGISVLVVFVAVLFQDRIFGSGSIFSYILGGGWERGLNVFAFTACLMFVCVALTVVYVVQRLLGLLSTVLGARGETVCRLMSSFIKYATIIGMVYYCLMLVGVDTTTLLASAGILSIAISFGAKELVSDILSGLFIIFEGEFRVGDIIKVGDWRGTVVEIGVRTTKVEDGSQNIKVIRNSDISNVVNMTKETSYASCDVGIEYGESLERVENILAQELPFIRRRLPAIIDGPFYKGVVSLGDNSVNIRIVVQCAETDRLQLERDLNREMKLMFDKYDISIPYPQVVINQPTEFKKVSDAEKRSADLFNEEQKAAAKSLGNDEDDETR